MNSVFYADMTEYLSLRKKVLKESSYAHDRSVLLDFDRYLAGQEKTELTVTESDITGWVQPMYSSLSRVAAAHKVSVLRMFLKYLREKGMCVYIPPYPKVPENYVPYLFSDEEIKKIFEAADTMSVTDSPKYGHLRRELPMLLRMLYSCGFRLGELLAAKVGDVNFKDGVILLRDTKNRKHRIVPMGSILTEMLNKYCLAMGLMESLENWIFPGQNPQKHLSQSTADKWFKMLLKETGLYIQPEKHTRGQCLHCFRHLFAVKSFAKMAQTGTPVQDSVPFLSVYLGHYDMDATEKYLKFSSDMFPEHTKLFEAYADGIFPEVRYED